MIRIAPFFFISLLFLSSCDPASSRLVPVDIEKPNPERLLSFYFGGYTPAPSQSGLLSQMDGTIFIDLNQLDSLSTGATLADSDNNGVISWEELEPFIQDTYYQSRDFPESISALHEQFPYSVEDDRWLVVPLRGMMTVALRTIYIEKEAVRSALLAYQENNKQLLYPEGTTIVAEHIVDESVMETTVMQKRNDGFWDFMVYDDQGTLTPFTTTDPNPLAAPTRCVGCHFGNKVFEPEYSFPSPSPDGPFGERGIYVDESFRDEAIATLLDEHAKRSDTILGLYGTLLLSEIKHRQQAGAVLTQEEALIFERFR